MNSFRKTAVVTGILFIVCSAATLLSYPFTGPVLSEPDYLDKLAAKGAMVITGALLEFVWAIACAGIAIGLYSVLRKYNRALALGSVMLRSIEGAFVLVGTLSLLALLTLSREFTASGAGSLQASGTLLIAARDWAHNFVIIIAFNLGALIYYFLMYKSRIVPRWLSGWGIIGVILSLASALIVAYTQNSAGFASIDTVLNIPIGLNEIVLAVWLIVKGFNPSAINSLIAGKGD